MKIPLKTSLAKLIFQSFVSGIAWATGASIGLTLLIAIISYILKLLGGLPFIGEIVGQVVQYTQEYLNNATSIN